jgi:hypothetical protein
MLGGGFDARSGLDDIGDRDGFNGNVGLGAQTYNPDYPVCLQTFGIFGESIECDYTSLAQCAPSARGRAAQCIVNPYFPSARQPANYRRHRRVY